MRSTQFSSKVVIRNMRNLLRAFSVMELRDLWLERLFRFLWFSCLPLQGSSSKRFTKDLLDCQEPWHLGKNMCQLTLKPQKKNLFMGRGRFFSSCLALLARVSSLSCSSVFSISLLTPHSDSQSHTFKIVAAVSAAE